ncbi:MAG: tyrosine recombinase XerC [Planctomycetaceae bacterium]|jgi:integrase/recombinase XerC|nr:tyrosine recombinase XerC [Planctomycetaceae bacterium]
MQNAIDRFLRYLRVERNSSDFTVKSYSEDMDAFIEYVNDLYGGRVPLPSEITTPQLRGYVSAMFEGEYSHATISRRLASLRSFFRYGLRAGWVTENPAKPLRNPRGNRKLPFFLTTEEVNSLLVAPPLLDPFGVRDRAILEVLYSSGVRVSELTGMNFGDVILKEGLVRVMGKGRKERFVLLGSFAADAIMDWYKYREALLNGELNVLGKPRTKRSLPKIAKNKPTPNDADIPVFLNKFGRRITTRSIGRMIEKYLKITGLDERTSPHTIRHTFATHLLNNGADIRSVQELLGHKSLITTQIYTHLTTANLLAIYQKAHPRANARD